MTKTTRIDGLDRLVKDMERFGKEAMPELQKTAHMAAEKILIDARSRINNKTGKLYRSLRVVDRPLVGDKFVVSSHVTWGDDVRDYAAPLELGHKIRNVKNGPILGQVKQHPFLRPAADANKRDYKNSMVEAINREIAKLGDAK